jgi:hypothetical protein
VNQDPLGAQAALLAAYPIDPQGARWSRDQWETAAASKVKFTGLIQNSQEVDPAV